MVNQQILEKARKYCVYQERCQSEMRTKLISWKIYGIKCEEIIACLIEEGFINEARFSLAYALEKFKFNHWGPNKIKAHLSAKQISSYCIKKACAQFEQEIILSKIDYLLKKYFRNNSPSEMYKLKQMVFNKGYSINDIDIVLADFNEI